MIDIDEFILEESDSGDGEEDTKEATDDHISEATYESDDQKKTEQERLGERKDKLDRARGKDQL